MSEDKKELTNKIIRLLARRDYSQRELQQRFVRDYSADLVDEVVAEMQVAGYQDDRRFAECFMRNRIASRYGWQRIKAELKQKGIDSELIAEVVEQQQVDWFELASEAWNKKFSLAPERGEQKLYAKQMRHLVQRGFSLDEAKYALEQAVYAQKEV